MSICAQGRDNSHNTISHECDWYYDNFHYIHSAEYSIKPTDDRRLYRRTDRSLRSNVRHYSHILRVVEPMPCVDTAAAFACGGAYSQSLLSIKCHDRR